MLLLNFITSFTRSKQLTFSILSNFRDRIYNDCIFYIWILRCENMIELEKLCNINKREKMKNNRNTQSISVNSNYNNFISNLAIDQELIFILVIMG